MGLTKRRDSYYVEFRVIDDGKTLKLATGIAGARLKRWKVGSLNRTAAKQQETLIKTDLMKGIVHSPQNKVVSFKEWGRIYLQLEEVRRLRSYQDRKEIMEHQLIPFFGSRLLTDIKATDVEAYRSQRRKKNGKPAKLQTINNDHIVLKRCLNVAKRQGLLALNPATLVPVPDPHNERDRVLTADEWKQLYDASEESLKPVLLVAYHLGQRAGEILNLTWDRVDLQRGFITLKVLDTKTKKPRQLPMTPAVKVAMQHLAKVRSLEHKNVFLKAGQPYTYEQMRGAFRKALKRSGIEDLRFHDLRHCAATNLRRAGIDPTIAMQIIGHKSAHMWKRYNTVADSDLRNAANLLNSFLTNTVITPAESGEDGAAASA